MTSLFPRRPKGARRTRWRSRPTARRCTWPTPTTTAWPSSTSPRPTKAVVKGFIPTGWYPTAVAVSPDGKTLLVGVGKGNREPRQSDHEESDPMKRKKADGDRPYPYIGTTMTGALSIVPVPDDEAARGLHRHGLSQLSLFRQAADGRALCRQDGDSDPGRRSVAHQARHLHHQGKPHLRSGLRRHQRRQRRSRAGDVRRKGHAQPSQAGRGVRPARQPLLQRPGVRAMAIPGRRWPTTPTTSPATGT